MARSIDLKIAKLLTLTEEHLQGGVTTGRGNKQSVQQELEYALRDPEVSQWLEMTQRQYGILKRP